MLDLAWRRLYLCVPGRDDMAEFLPAVLRGGVDVVQLREKEAPDSERVRVATVMVRICRDFNVPFIMNDSPELAMEVGADGVHVGQDDVSVEHCRQVLGSQAIVGLSTHSAFELDAALTTTATYLSAGPIVETPTKPGRRATGIDYPVAAQALSGRPVFVTGGVSEANVATFVAAGLRHFVVVRAITDAPDPGAAARSIRAAIEEALTHR